MHAHIKMKMETIIYYMLQLKLCPFYLSIFINIYGPNSDTQDFNTSLMEKIVDCQKQTVLNNRRLFQSSNGQRFRLNKL